MLDALFVKVVSMSITAALVVLVILPVRFLLRRAPKLFSYLLWCIVLFRLLCPVSFTTQISVLRFANSIDGSSDHIRQMFQMPEQQDKSTAAIAASDDAAGTVQKGVKGQGILNEQAQKGFYDDTWISLCEAVWLAGIAVMLGCSLMSAIRMRRRLIGAVRLRDNIYLSDYIASPFVYGMFRARIYLPSALAETEREYIILHEQIHIRRRDHLLKMTAFAALIVHWFNPFVWLAFYLSEKDMEMSCDEAVIKRLGSSIRAEYSSSLLRLAAGRRIFEGTLAAFGEGDTGSRIKHVMEYKKPASVVLIAAVVILAATVVSAGSDPGKQNDAVSADGAEKILKDYLINANLWQSDYMLEVNVPAEGKTDTAGDDQVYQFDLRMSDQAETSAGRLIADYAVTYDGSKIYQYDPAELEFKELTYEGAGERILRFDSPQKGYVELYRSPKLADRIAWMQDFGLDDDYAHQTECAFILSITDDTIEVDVAEYIVREDTERVRELGLTEYDMPDGYEFYNPDTDTVTWKLDENIRYMFIDWGGDFSPDGPGYVSTKESSVFQSYLKPYLLPTPRMPFFFQVEDGVVKLIVEVPFA